MEILSETALHPGDARSYGIVQRRHFGGLVNLVINLAAVLRRFIKADYLDFRRIEADESHAVFLFRKLFLRILLLESSEEF